MDSYFVRSGSVRLCKATCTVWWLLARLDCNVLVVFFSETTTQHVMSVSMIRVLGIVLLALPFSSGLYFHIAETERKCFIEEIPDDTMVVGKYKVDGYYNNLNFSSKAVYLLYTAKLLRNYIKVCIVKFGAGQQSIVNCQQTCRSLLFFCIPYF